MPISKRRNPWISRIGDDDLLDLPLSGGSPVPDLRESLILDPSEGEPGDSPPPARPPGRRRGAGWLWLVLVLAFPLGGLVGYFLHSGPAVASLSSDLLDFGEVRLGTGVRELALEVSNQGERDLRIGAAGLQGEAAGEFRVLADECAGAEIAPLATCTVRVAFSPQALGVRRARIRLEGNVESPHTVPLYGVAVAPELSVEPRQLDLGRTKVGTAGAPGTLRLENRGTAPVRIGRLELRGGAADFRLVADGCSSKSLDAGERCTVGYVFTPRSAGERRASVRIENDAVAEPLSASLVGYALALRPLLRPSLERLDFERLAVGQTSPSRTLRLANDGDGPLKIRGIRLEETGDVAAGGAFEVAAENCTGDRVAAGGWCDIEVRFRPLVENAARSFLAVDSDAGPHRLPLTGFGTAPHVAVEPRRLSFGEVGSSATSAPRELRISSSGSADLVIGKIEVTGADAGSFAVRGCAVRLEPGASCAVEVRFSPRRAGPHRAELRIRHNAEDRHQVSLNGLGVTARLSLDQSRLAFVDVEVGTEARRRLTISNGGRADLRIRRLRLTGGAGSGFELAGDRCTGTLRPGSSCSVIVRFKPTTTGARSVRLAIEHSASKLPREVPVSASATAPPVPEIRFDPAGLGFDDRPVGERGTIRTLRILNPGTGRLNLGEIRVGGANPSDFELVPGSCDGAPYVAPGSSCTVGVRFTPTAAGTRGGWIVVRHDAAGRRTQLELTGWGSAQ